MLYKKFDYSQIIVISDPHAHLKTTLELIKQLPKNIPIFFIGDLIDKGKRAKELVDYVKQNHNALLGNHDHLMTVENLPRLWKRYESLWLINSGKMTQRSYGGKWKIQNREANKLKFIEHVNWFKSLPLIGHFPNIKINGKDLVLSHAGIDQACKLAGDFDNLIDILNNNSRDDLLKNHLKDAENLNQQIATSILWNVLDRDSDFSNLPVYNVFGHTTQKDVVIKDNFSCVDTGVYKSDGKLSALLLPSFQVFSQDTLDDSWGEKK